MMTSENKPPVNDEPIERIILRSMTEGVITLECTGSVFSANPAALKILCLAEDQLVGRLFAEVFPTGSANEELGLFASEMISGSIRSSSKDICYTRPDGQVLDLSLTGSFLESDVCVPGMQDFVVVFRDITAFKALERMKRRAVNHLSHELRTPLALIAGSLELMSRDDVPRQRLSTSLERARRNLKRLTAIQAIVENILDPPKLKPSPIHLPSTVDEMLGRLRDEFTHREVTVGSDIISENTDFIDPAILWIVLESLLKNAVEASPDGAEIIVSAKRIPEGILFGVEDRGVGIPLRDREFMFHGFHHTQPTDEYSSKRPYSFNAGGKGLELLRLKTMADAGIFEISFSSDRCKYISDGIHHCTGIISTCPFVKSVEDCKKSGGTFFSVLFRSR